MKEKAIVCTGCGRPVDEPGSVTDSAVADWSVGLLLMMMFASIFFPPIGLIVGFKGLFSAATKVKAAVLLTVATIMALLWAALVLGL
ncbi:MAG: hypothetical protein ACKN9T_14435 [Candidatus Methylumidiphilus sp.]